MILNSVPWPLMMFNSSQLCSLALHGPPWYFMALHAVPWPSMVFYGSQWCPTVLNSVYGLQGSSKVFLSVSWPSMVLHGPTWPSMVFRGPPWRSMVLNGHQRCFMALLGVPWPSKWGSITFHAVTWPSMAPNGVLGPSRAFCGIYLYSIVFLGPHGMTQG